MIVNYQTTKISKRFISLLNFDQDIESPLNYLLYVVPTFSDEILFSNFDLYIEFGVLPAHMSNFQSLPEIKTFQRFRRLFIDTV